jgi:ADP-heptose:LPS heptosyltransferase
MKIFGTRMSLIGDIIMSLPVLQKLCEIVDKPYVYFSIAQKCKQSAPLFYNHPLIQEIKISDQFEDLGENDFKIIKECDIVLPVRPNPPDQFDWYNYRSLIEETTRMAGFSQSFTADTVPILYVNKEIPHIKQKTIAIWPFAGYGKGSSRSPNIEWWKNTCDALTRKGFNILHCGVNNEPDIFTGDQYSRITNLEFADQIYYSLGCCGAIGTDSGSMWVIAAYHQIPQINLITNWLPNHNKNLLSLAPVGKKVRNLYADNGCSNININDVVNSVYENFCL